MRRLRVLLAGVLAVGTTIVWSGVVYADRPALGGFCGDVQGFIDDIESSGIDDIDFTDPEAAQELFGDAAEAFNSLAGDAPKKLKKPFKTVAKYYAGLAEQEIDFSDPEALDEFIPSAKVTRAFEKISTYLTDECGIDLEGTDTEE